MPLLYATLGVPKLTKFCALVLVGLIQVRGITNGTPVLENKIINKSFSDQYKDISKARVKGIVNFLQCSLYIKPR